MPRSLLPLLIVLWGCSSNLHFGQRDDASVSVETDVGSPDGAAADTAIPEDASVEDALDAEIGEAFDSGTIDGSTDAETSDGSTFDVDSAAPGDDAGVAVEDGGIRAEAPMLRLSTPVTGSAAPPPLRQFALAISDVRSRKREPAKAERVYSLPQTKFALTHVMRASASS